MAENALQVSAQQTLPARQTFEPTTLQEALEFSKILAESELVPKDFKNKPGNVFVAIQMGKELGVPPLQALQGIAVINNRATVWGDLMWALVTSHPEFEDAKEDVTDTGATVTLKRRGRSPVTVTFTKADAEKAQLWGKAGPWQNYPKRQLQWRARTFAARDLFPDALKGMISAEEASDYPPGPVIDGGALSSSPTAQPAPAPPPTIGKDKGMEFYKAYRGFGWMPDDAAKYLSDTLGWKTETVGTRLELRDTSGAVKTSQDIPEAKFEEVMKWAKEKSPVRKQADEVCVKLGFTDDETMKFYNDHKSNWPEIVKDLQVELDKRDALEQ